MELFMSFLIEECSRSNNFIHNVIECIKLDENVVAASCLMHNSSTKAVNQRVRRFYEEVVPSMSLDIFRSHFRMSRTSMEELCREMAPHIQSQHKFERVPVEKKVLMCVWSLANQDVYRKIGNLFDTSRGGAQSCVMEICAAISSHLKPIYVRLPSSSESRAMASAVEEKTGFPGICGYIDGTHIPVKAPAWDRDSYINRKGFASVNVLAVCDNNMRFTYVYADRAGSVHDARVLRVSSLGQMLESQSWPMQESLHILGDSAYPLLPNLLVPYRDNGHLSSVQRLYNNVHSSARCVIERAFARLKGKFRRLKGIDATCMRNALHFIEAACTLHNFIIEHEGCENLSDDEDDVIDSSEVQCLPSTAHVMGSNAIKLQAKQKRDNIASAL